MQSCEGCACFHKSRCRCKVWRNHREDSLCPCEGFLESLGIVIICDYDLCSALAPQISLAGFRRTARTCLLWANRWLATAPPTWPVIPMTANIFIPLLVPVLI